ncbi:hypothetical protein SAMN02745131_04163 [Flavisolibacter ginsengisoli DSM 18119]|jgi:hypothetical protein|uniref:Uncharacterized protein n=1 Tax=Flavisolibacter ginsengisoli DSM 18119 TaxID=1121884 RepID=A0A1M5GIY4_9BACT|nr:hypothetical protein SAMN02745131_04163 [Flavisolibacter ginsengisoli DSM 18119]
MVVNRVALKMICSHLAFGRLIDALFIQYPGSPQGYSPTHNSRTQAGTMRKLLSVVCISLLEEVLKGKHQVKFLQHPGSPQDSSPTHNGRPRADAMISINRKHLHPGSTLLGHVHKQGTQGDSSIEL